MRKAKMRPPEDEIAIRFLRRWLCSATPPLGTPGGVLQRDTDNIYRVQLITSFRSTLLE